MVAKTYEGARQQARTNATYFRCNYSVWYDTAGRIHVCKERAVPKGIVPIITYAHSEHELNVPVDCVV